MKYFLFGAFLAAAIWMAQFGWSRINDSFLSVWTHERDYNIGRASLVTAFVFALIAIMPFAL